MRPFDWISFLSSRNIPFVTTGPNTGAGEISIRCPWCADDPSQHLGIALDGAGFHCWRNPKHAGRNPARLVAVLAHCSLEQALAITGSRGAIPDDWLSHCRSLLSPPEGPAVAQRRPLALPDSFRPFSPVRSANSLQGPFTAYLRRRGIGLAGPPHGIGSLTLDYGLYWDILSRWRYRIIFTVVQNRLLRGWTGRATQPELEPRYLAEGPVRDCLWRYDDLLATRAKVLVLCEGPFDALTISWHGGGAIEATCLFGIAPSAAQINLLHHLLPRFARCYITPDRGAEHRGLATLAQLDGLGAAIRFLPPPFGDPGELTRAAVRHLYQE